MQTIKAVFGQILLVLVVLSLVAVVAATLIGLFFELTRGHGDPDVCELVLQPNEVPHGFNNWKRDESKMYESLSKEPAEQAGLAGMCAWHYTKGFLEERTYDPDVTSVVKVYKSEDQAKDALTKMVDGRLENGQTQLPSIPDLGDESYALQSVLKLAVFSASNNTLAWRQGNTVAYIDIGGDSAQGYAAQAITCAQKVQARLK